MYTFHSIKHTRDAWLGVDREKKKKRHFINLFRSEKVRLKQKILNASGSRSNITRTAKDRSES